MTEFDLICGVIAFLGACYALSEWAEGRAEERDRQETHERAVKAVVRMSKKVRAARLALVALLLTVTAPVGG